MALNEDNHFNYLTINETDQKWGLYVTTCGFQSIKPHSSINPYLNKHLSSYTFNTKQGRVLDEFQLLFVVKGSGFFQSASVQKTKIETGSMIMLFPQEWHNYSFSKETGWDEFWVGFNGDHARSIVQQGFFRKEEPIFKLGINDEFVSLYRQIISYAEQENQAYQQIISGIVRHMLGLLYYKSRNIVVSNKSVVDKINQARIVMRENVSSPQAPEDIASQLGVSYSWFRKAFKKYTGISPAQFQMNLRLQHAKDMLMNSDKSITEIAYELNFESTGQFSTFFKHKTGTTPKEFRSVASSPGPY